MLRLKKQAKQNKAKMIQITKKHQTNRKAKKKPFENVYAWTTATFMIALHANF